MIKVVEYGPFGCQLNKGIVNSLDEIPDGYEVVRVEVSEKMIVYIDPIKDLIIAKEKIV
jgi:hypothetical protein